MRREQQLSVAAALIFLMVQQPHRTQPTIFLIGTRLAKIAQPENFSEDAGAPERSLHEPEKWNS
jgi:hypothetical protein